MRCASLEQDEPIEVIVFIFSSLGRKLACFWRNMNGAGLSLFPICQKLEPGNRKMETGSLRAENQTERHRSGNEAGMCFRINRWVARFTSLFPIAETGKSKLETGRLKMEVGNWKLGAGRASSRGTAIPSRCSGQALAAVGRGRESLKSSAPSMLNIFEFRRLNFHFPVSIFQFRAAEPRLNGGRRSVIMETSGTNFFGEEAL
jgi:hypothetical protein